MEERAGNKNRIFDSNKQLGKRDFYFLGVARACCFLIHSFTSVNYFFILSTSLHSLFCLFFSSRGERSGSKKMRSDTAHG